MNELIKIRDVSTKYDISARTLRYKGWMHSETFLYTATLKPYRVTLILCFQCTKCTHWCIITRIALEQVIQKCHMCRWKYFKTQEKPVVTGFSASSGFYQARRFFMSTSVGVNKVPQFP